MSGMLRFGLALAALSVLAFAQEQLEVSQPEPGTIRVGDSARVTIRVEGASANPRAPELPAVDGLRMRLLGPSRNSYTFYDGRRLIERVGVQYIVELQPTRAGIFEVPEATYLWTAQKVKGAYADATMKLVALPAPPHVPLYLFGEMKVQCG